MAEWARMDGSQTWPGQNNLRSRSIWLGLALAAGFQSASFAYRIEQPTPVADVDSYAEILRNLNRRCTFLRNRLVNAPSAVRSLVSIA